MPDHLPAITDFAEQLALEAGELIRRPVLAVRELLRMSRALATEPAKLAKKGSKLVAVSSEPLAFSSQPKPASHPAPAFLGLLPPLGPLALNRLNPSSSRVGQP